MSQVTKRALEQSLKNFLLKNPLTKSTIMEIAEDCGITLMIFYYHFKDIYDLVEWSCTEDARKALEVKNTYDTWQQGFFQIFEAVRENTPFILKEIYVDFLYQTSTILVIGMCIEICYHPCLRVSGVTLNSFDVALICSFREVLQ